jgi:hypothetical protein
MHSHLYAQTGHFVTPQEMGVFMILLVLVALVAVGKAIFS